MSTSPLVTRRREETVEFRLIFATAFIVFLVAATVGRLLLGQWQPHRAGGSVFAEARAAASTIVPFAFMG
jgi:hypothetical protein